MMSLAQMLIGATGHSAVTQRKYSGKTSARTFASLARNADKPCRKCGEPRHKSKNGRVFTALCTAHYTEAQAIQRESRLAQKIKPCA